MSASSLSLLRSVMEGLGLRPGSIRESFDARLRMQKAVFILAGLELEPRLRGYLGTYSLYAHGPYSPVLARDYYKLAEQPGAAAPEPLSPKAVKALEIMAGARSDVLELAATLLDIAMSYHRAGLTGRLWPPDRRRETLRRHLRMIKPWADQEDIREAWRLLDRLARL